MSRGRSAAEASSTHPAPPPFLNKTYDLVEDLSTNDIVSWSPEGLSFVVWKPAEFAAQLLPRHFKHNNFSSFVRQLNTYGFRKVDPDRWEFSNECFVRGHKELLHEIHRRKTAPGPTNQQHSHISSASAIEVGSFGGLSDEVEALKRDKNLLMVELVRLRQHQQSSEKEILGLHKRLQGMETRQQQMMSFLAKALQSPQFLQQVLQAQRPSRLTSGRKKRRATRYDSESGTESPRDEEPVDTTSALVQYQPQAEFAQRLADLLKDEPASPPPGEAWPGSGGGGGNAHPLADVDTAFNSMNLAGARPLGSDDDALRRMPHIPGMAGMMPSITEEGVASSRDDLSTAGLRGAPNGASPPMQNGVASVQDAAAWVPPEADGQAMNFSPDDYLDLGMELGRLTSAELMSFDDAAPENFWQNLEAAAPDIKPDIPVAAATRQGGNNLAVPSAPAS